MRIQTLFNTNFAVRKLWLPVGKLQTVFWDLQIGRLH